eukprot:SAG22_NODE_1123_length_5488_cov_53.464465_6_plen_78_part_00
MRKDGERFAAAVAQLHPGEQSRGTAVVLLAMLAAELLRGGHLPGLDMTESALPPHLELVESVSVTHHLFILPLAMHG